MKELMINGIPVSREVLLQVLKEVQTRKFSYIKKSETARNEGIKKSCQLKLERLDEFTAIVEYATEISPRNKMLEGR